MADQVFLDIALDSASVLANGYSGIGTLGEKTLHRTLKYYFEPDESKHEIEFLGHVADIMNEDGIVEIQTASFDRLIPKLEHFLQTTRVRVVYPIVANRYICRIDTESGESNSPRKSSKKGRASDALIGLSVIRRFIPHPNLSILVVLVDATETRMLGGTKKVGRKRTEKIDCIPTKINSIIFLDNPKDYFSLLPDNLPKEFSAKDFEKCAKIRGISSHGALMLLLKLGVLTRDKKGGRSYIYSINQTY